MPSVENDVLPKIKKSMNYGKKKNLWILLITMVVSSFTLTSCVDNQDNPIGGGGESGDKDKKYVERLFPVVDPKNNSLGTVLLRFYQDMPNVAYISVSHYQEMMYPGTTIQVAGLGDGKYALTNPFGTAKVDTEKDLFTSNDYEAFTNMMGMIQPGMPNIIYDALPIIRFKSLDASPKQVDVTLDYGKYGIDIRENGDNVYFPFATISDLYVDNYMHVSNFNGQTVMVTPDGSFSLINGYPSFFITPLLKDTRTDDMADYSYKNLCFTLTNFFGYPGRTLLEKSMKEKGLDQALQDYGKGGQMTRELLKSKDMYDFFSGTATLEYLLFDGGHTHTALIAINAIDTASSFMHKVDQLIQTKYAEFDEYCPEILPIKESMADRALLKGLLSKQREEKFGKGVNYTKVGNTAYCCFNEFMGDFSIWKKYYKGEGPKPTIDQYPDDWLVILIDALEKAQNDPEVKNFIIDLSTNGGGSSDIVLFITSMICNKADMYWENSLTGQKMKSTFDVDRNLDGKFDEKDNDVKLNLNIGVLTSPCSFSCGNLLPALLKDYGICLLGMRSAGGACCVLFNPSADGFGYSYSTHRCRLTNLKGENIDGGIEPDYKLELYDYFDIPKVGKLIEEFYAK